MPRKSRKNVGLIGLGIIGSRVATGLRAVGFQVFVWNRTVKPAPNFLGSPAEVAEVCEILQIFVGDAQALFDVIDQLSDALTPQHVVICNATVGPEATLEAARLVEERGARFLDAPFTGSRGAAEKRDLVYYIGGDDATFLRARPVLEASSRAIVRIGAIGHAATIKVVTNMIAAVSIQVLGEALAIVQKAGLDPDVFATALEHNACRSATMDLKLPKMVAGNFEPHFSLKHMFKDIQLGIHVANGLEIEIPATTVTAGVMYGALNQGWADLDFSAVYKVYESEAAPALRVPLEEGHVQIEDLDSREEHYPETRIAAPPRPAAPDAPADRSASEGDTASERRPELPTLAGVLHAPEGVAPPASSPVPDSAPLGFEDTLLDFPETAVENPDASQSKAEIPSLVLLPPPEESTSRHSAEGHSSRPEPAPHAEEPAREHREGSGTNLQRASESEPSTAPGLAGEPANALSNAEATPNRAADAPAATATAESAPLSTDESSAEKSASKDTSESSIKPVNFVKRWFVARRGG